MARRSDRAEVIQSRARHANWATIGFGFFGLSGLLIAVAEGVYWLTYRRWPTIGNLTGWMPHQAWERPIAFVPLSLLVLLGGGAAFWSALLYWRRQEALLRRLRGKPRFGGR